MEKLHLTSDYKSFVETIKSTIRSAQIKAALTVNEQLIKLYWDIGSRIVSEQERLGWGAAVVQQLAVDLKRDMPDVGGFSRSNIFYMRQFYKYYRDADEKVQQLAGQIPWWHNVLIFSKIKDIVAAEFYLIQTIQHNWSRNILDLQIDSKLHERQGKAVHNFGKTLPLPQADLAAQLLKDPYNFGFLTIDQDAMELDVERQLVQHVINLLLEMGTGFAFVTRQHRFTVGDSDYSVDLVFYNFKLHCFVLVDLKMKPFHPSDAGQMNFYLSAADDLLRGEGDAPSIGIILCRSKNHVAVEYALRGTNKPIGVSDYIFTTLLPDNLKPTLPSVEDMEKELNERLKKTSSKRK
jgi:predicted nuclease of restriction endonuclease-like (RecB) superfamily